MKLIIDIPDKVWNKAKEKGDLDICGIELYERVMNGEPYEESQTAESGAKLAAYKEAFNKTIEEMKAECRAMPNPMEYMYYGEALGTFEQTFNKYLRTHGIDV